jgi:hypothetical protein
LVKSALPLLVSAPLVERHCRGRRQRQRGLRHNRKIIMDFITAIFGALKEFFAFKTKTALTPVQKEKQQARNEKDENKKFIDGWMGGDLDSNGKLRRDQDSPSDTDKQ